MLIFSSMLLSAILQQELHLQFRGCTEKYCFWTSCQWMKTPNVWNFGCIIVLHILYVGDRQSRCLYLQSAFALRMENQRFEANKALFYSFWCWFQNFENDWTVFDQQLRQNIVSTSHGSFIEWTGNNLRYLVAWRPSTLSFFVMLRRL